MAGNGRAPEKLAPEIIAALRHRYVDTDQPVREIVRDFGISGGKLNRLIKAEGWPMRQDRPPRGLPPALKLLEEARLLSARPAMARTAPPRPDPLPAGERKHTPDQTAGPHPSRLGAPRLAPQDDGSKQGASRLSPQDDGSKLGAPCPAPQDDESKFDASCPASPDDGLSPPATGSGIDRLERLVFRELAAEEAGRERLGNAPRVLADAERSARTLSILTQTLQNLQRLRADGARAAPIEPRHNDDDIPADLDEFRFDLARRIEAFVASRADESDADADRPAGAVGKI